MDTVGARWAAGVFRRLDHLVTPDARAIDFRGARVSFALCGAATVTVDVMVRYGTRCAACDETASRNVEVSTVRNGRISETVYFGGRVG